MRNFLGGLCSGRGRGLRTLLLGRLDFFAALGGFNQRQSAVYENMMGSDVGWIVKFDSLESTKKNLEF